MLAAWFTPKLQLCTKNTSISIHNSTVMFLKVAGGDAQRLGVSSLLDTPFLAGDPSN